MGEVLKAPMPYFGGKSHIASEVWKRFGQVDAYVEPFFGSGAVLLGRPGNDFGVETVNDISGLLCNFYRALRSVPDEVAYWADWPVSEIDLHARNRQVTPIHEELQVKLEADPDFFDAKVAGWWGWGTCSSFGRSGWGSTPNISAGRPQLGNAGHGIHRQLVNTKEYDFGEGACVEYTKALHAYFRRLADRLRYVRVCCGDWSRVVGRSATTTHGMAAIFLDPPYSKESGRSANLYAVDDMNVAHVVREWCLEHGDDPQLRLALCGYEGEHDMPASWSCYYWTASGGFDDKGSAGAANRKRERVYFSPACKQVTLF